VGFAHPRSGADHELTITRGRSGSLLVSGAAKGSSDAVPQLAVTGVEVGQDRVAAEVGGERLAGSWCLHR
jgi:hypothetical protein